MLYPVHCDLPQCRHSPTPVSSFRDVLRADRRANHFPLSCECAAHVGVCFYVWVLWSDSLFMPDTAALCWRLSSKCHIVFSTHQQRNECWSNSFSGVLSGPIAGRPFHRFPVEIDEEAEKYRPRHASVAARDLDDLWCERPCARTVCGLDDSPRGGESVLSHRLEVGPGSRGLLELTSAIQSSLAARQKGEGVSLCGSSAPQKWGSERVCGCVREWAGCRQPPSIYIYTLLSGGCARPCFQVLNVFWGAVVGDKMAISAVSRAGIGFQQMHSGTAASEGNWEILNRNDKVIWAGWGAHSAG